MNKRSQFLLKNVGILTISNFASKILVFLLVPLYTSVLSTTEYGTYDLIVSTVSMVCPILTANIVDAVMRFCMDVSYAKDDVIAVGLKYVLRSVVIAAIIAVAVHCLDVSLPIDYLEWFVFLYYLFYVLNQFFIQLAKGLERVKDMAVAGVLGTIVMLGANILFLLVIRCGLMGFFLANILAQAVPVVYLAVRLKIWTYVKWTKADKRIQKEMLVYCVPLILTVLGWWINSAADKYVVVFMCGLAANGILSVAYKIPSIINILQGIFTQAWQISAIKEYGESGTAEFYGSIFNTVNVLMCAACSWLILLTKPIANILYAKDFYQAWKYVPFLLISSVLNCASGFLGPVLSAKKDSKTMAMSAIYGSAINVILNILLVYAVGVQGATIATVISSFIIYIVRKRAVKEDIVIVHYGSVLLTWGLLCVQALVGIYTPFWYLEVLLMVVMLFVNFVQFTNIVGMLANLRKC